MAPQQRGQQVMHAARDAGRRRRRSRRVRRVAAALGGAALAGVALPLAGQEPRTPPAPLDTVRVTVTREVARSPLELPFAVTTLRPDSARPGQRHQELAEMLQFLPGVTVASRGNPTQDPRIAIRGFGARSAFGVRGIRVLRDGMPLTLPDGQTPTDYLDLESVGTIEVIRGSASALYGNAAGGVIDIRSAAAPRDPVAAELRISAGSNNVQRGEAERWEAGRWNDARRWVAAVGGSVRPVSYQANVAHAESDGFRDWARQRTTTGFGRVQTTLGGTELALVALGFDMPLALNPGALTRAQFEQDPTLPDSQNVRRRARKEVSQVQLGLVASRRAGERELAASAYGGARDLYNPLAFAIVDIGRATYGGSLRGTAPVRLLGVTHRLSAGADLQRLDDDRKNFANCNGLAAVTTQCPDLAVERGAVTLDQRELVTNAGVFARDEVALGGRFLVSVGVRADAVRFDVEDRLVIPGTNPDDSGERTLDAVSPMAGLVARLAPLHALYASVSSAFETPTATELANRPDAAGGINPDLEPQYATTYEAGLKGFLLARVQYDVAAFHTNVADELISFEVPNGQGRRFFRNAGETRRRGVEAALAAPAGPLELGLAYTYGHFEFVDYMVVSNAGQDTVRYDGNRIPGVPGQQLQASATWRRRGAFATAEAVVSDEMYVSDANTERAPGYGVVNLRAGGGVTVGRSRLAPVLAVYNLFDRRYAPSIVVNAAGGRYYEPAPGRTIYAGLSLAVGR